MIRVVFFGITVGYITWGTLAILIVLALLAGIALARFMIGIW